MTGTAPLRSPATDWCAALLDELIAQGLDHIVVCPGSRSQALALAAADAHRRGRVRVHVRIDERSAGFLALGLARESGKPAAIIVTSGSAIGNLSPAVMEAHHAGIPMLLLTADRPQELRHVGANQATYQVGFFGDFVRFSQDLPTPDPATDTAQARRIADSAWAAALAVPAGPAHLNIPLREPLAGALPAWWSGSDPLGRRVMRASGQAATQRSAIGGQRWPEARTIVLAGADAGPVAAAVAAQLELPLLAEIVSGARVDDTAWADYVGLLQDSEFASQIERVIVFGHPTLTRPVAGLLQRRDVDIRAVAGPGELLNLNGATRATSAAEVLESQPAGAEWARGWRRSWSAAGADSDDRREILVREVWAASAPQDRVFFASSRLVRVADRVLEPRNVRVHASRGLAGIDGTIATASGIALAVPEAALPEAAQPDSAELPHSGHLPNSAHLGLEISGDAQISGVGQTAPAESITRVIVGDLAFLHDAGSLLLPPNEHEPAPRIQVIVGNDGGGTIFHDLEVARVADPADFDRVQYTPHQVDIASLARAYGWAYTRAEPAQQLREALRAGHTPGIIEVPLPR